MTSTTSAASATRRISLAIAPGSSGCTSLTRGRAPVCATREASRRELLSVISPGPSADPTGRISSPVGMIAVTGCRVTFSVACPAVAAAARPAARSRWPAGSSWLAGKSSPPARTFSPRRRAGDLGAAVGAELDPLAFHHRVQACRHQIAGIDPGERRGGQLPDAGGTGGPALIAMPSIAAQAERGEGQRARTATAVTRPSPSRTGTSSAAGRPRQPAAAHASIHCE